MINKICREIPLFEELGLFTEAPKKKRKVRVISVRPINKDYTSYLEPDEELDIGDEEIDDLGDDITDYDTIDEEDYDTEPEDLGLDGLDGLELSDINEDDIENAANNPEEVTDAEDTAVTEEQPEEETQVPPIEDTTTTEEQPVEDTPTAEEKQPEEGVPEDGENEVIDATGEGEDPEVTEDMGEEVQLDETPVDGTDPNAVPAGTANAQTPQESVTKDDLRKFELYKRFMDLYNSIQYFIEKLENTISDDEKFESTIKKVLSKFKQLEELTKDYMILKFQSDKFLQNSFFYEKIKACSLLAIELLNTNKIDKSK